MDTNSEHAIAIGIANSTHLLASFPGRSHLQYFQAVSTSSIWSLTVIL